AGDVWTLTVDGTPFAYPVLTSALDPNGVASAFAGRFAPAAAGRLAGYTAFAVGGIVYVTRTGTTAPVAAVGVVRSATGRFDRDGARHGDRLRAAGVRERQRPRPDLVGRARRDPGRLRGAEADEAAEHHRLERARDRHADPLPRGLHRADRRLPVGRGLDA